jgi:hypothetical protein
MGDQPNFGPYSKWENIAAYFSVSEKALALFDEAIRANWERLTTATHHLFVRFAYQAKTTSLAIRINTSWALVMPAFALTRVRLEQAIVCSYLLHEDTERGIVPFVKYIPIGQHRGTQAAMEDAELAKRLTGQIDHEKLEADAITAQEELTPGFTIENGKFQRNWTLLDLRSMAKRRDALVQNKPPLHEHPLEREYLSIYKVASSVVHADCSSLSYHYLDLFPSSSGTPVLMAKPVWATIVAAATAHYDILQAHEILSWMGIQDDTRFKGLMTEWRACRDNGAGNAAM